MIPVFRTIALKDMAGRRNRTTTARRPKPLLVNAFKITIERGTVTYHSPRITYSTPIRLDPAKSPATIDLYEPDSVGWHIKLKGIYVVDNDQLLLLCDMISTAVRTRVSIGGRR